MKIKTHHGSGRYPYAIADAPEHSACGDIGINAAAVYAVSQGPAAVVVSNITDKRIQPEHSKLCALCRRGIT